MKILKLLIAFVMLSTLLLAKEPTLINIPCANYKKGNMWKFHRENKQMKSDIVTTVESIEDSSIQLRDTTTSTVTLPNFKNVSTSTMTFMLKKQKNSIYSNGEITNNNGIESTNTYSAPVPFCGEIPTSFTYTSQYKSSLNQNSPKMKFTVNVKKIGEKKI